MSSASIPVGASAWMADHFEDSIEIKDSIIAGDLRGVRSPALHLTEQGRDFPSPWIPFISANVQLATAALTAGTLEEAAQAAAGLANNCGECHAAAGHGPRFSVSHPPKRPGGQDARRYMARHQWAADRMWESLVEHNDAGWYAGATAMSDAPLITRELSTSEKFSETALKLNDRVMELGRRARSTSAWDARTRLYGAIIASCAGCHTRVM